MRKISLLLICLCLLIFLPSILGTFAKTYFHFLGWDVNYATISWKDKSLVLTDLELTHSSLSFQVPVLKISLFDRHLTLFRPVVQISEIPNFDRSSSWTYTVEEGRLEGVITGTFQMQNEEAEWHCVYQNIHCIGKGVIDQWLETNLYSGDSALSVLYKDSQFELSAHVVNPEFANAILTILDRFGYSGCSMLKGTLSGSIQVAKGEIKVLEAQASHCLFQKDRLCVGCEIAIVTDGKYSFSGGSYFIDDQLFGKNWEGAGELSGIGKISGNIGSFHLTSQYFGTLQEMAMQLQWNGPFKGEGLFKLVRRDDGWDFSFHEEKGDLLEDLQFSGKFGVEGFCCYDVKGVLSLGKKVPFYCPIIESNGQFDLRFVHPIFDLARLCGTSDGGDFVIDPTRSHFLGTPVTKGWTNLKKFELECSLPWKLLTFFTDIPSIYRENEIGCRITYNQENTKIDLQSSLYIQDHEIPIAISFENLGAAWHFSTHFWEGKLEGECLLDREGLLITKGKGLWENRFQGDFSGRMATFGQGELKLSNLQMELGILRSELQGEVKGEGILHWKDVLEADFDLFARKFKIKDWELENEGSIHIFCSSAMGMVVQGLNISFESANCRIGLLQYKFADSQPVFSLTQSQFYLPSLFLTKFGLSNRAAMHGNADFSFSSDLTKVSLTMKEGVIPYEDEQFSIWNLHAVMNDNQGNVNFDLEHHSRLIPIDLSFLLDSDIKGRLKVDNTLKADFLLSDHLCVQSIVGKCFGVDASFHLDGDTLIGSAQINGNEIRQILPEKLAEVFNDLNIGNGYELMGRLNFKEGLGFKGILSGKQIELFGFELRNLLSQIEWDYDHLHISDLKICDIAGTLKVEEIIAERKGKDPWTLSIPHIMITELRPTLLQDVGGPPGTLSPLVVREIRIDDFKGCVDDSKTYTAHGELFFINSYKRENSIFELPSDILSRIFGLDLELLTPVCGRLKYELHDGFFHFTELLETYSENKRSEFFLIFNDESPKMDLDWNLNIFIQTKQFVLFKFTEAFLISVTGKLDDPKIKLQRKKHFFGVL